MNWAYRVFHDSEGYCVRVLLYKRDGTLVGYHHTPAIPHGDTLEELTQDLALFQEAFLLPVLTIDQLEAEIAQQQHYTRMPKRLPELVMEHLNERMVMV